MVHRGPQEKIAHIFGHDMSSAAVDILTCFDQIIRDVIYLVMEYTGAPHRVIRAYTAMLERLTVYHVIAGTLREGHKHSCGIPQGCPLPMLFIAIMLLPWCKLMRRMQATPKVLADDVFVHTTGEEHLWLFRRAYDATRAYIRDIRRAHIKQPQTHTQT